MRRSGTRKGCGKRQPKLKIGKRDESTFWSRIVYYSPHHWTLVHNVELTHCQRMSKGMILFVGNLCYEKSLGPGRMVIK